MVKGFVLGFILWCGVVSVFALGVPLVESEEILREAEFEADSAAWHQSIEQVVVRGSTKETNNPWKVPSSVTLLTPSKIQQNGVISIKGLSSLIPNMYIPDYGSRMTSAIYLRGVGARSSGQSVGFYVDNIPVMDKSGFDFDMTDIQRIEVLRGPQGTLYGRNAMGGIINLYTLSPMSYQGTRAQIGVSNYDGYMARVSHYAKFSDKVALAVGAKYRSQGGFFPNRATGRRADSETSAGANLKLEWRMAPRLLMTLTGSYDYTHQGAFPYGLYDKQSGQVYDVAFNDAGSYLRNMSSTGLRFEYTNEQFVISSNTGYGYLRDDMKMDQDFTPQSVFTINQRQMQHAVNQEFVIRSNTTRNYQWSCGAFAFYNGMTTDGDVEFGADGIRTVLQPIFDNMPAPAPRMTITDSSIPNPGTYKTPSAGVALFHQSTFNNIFTEGLSLTVGLRADFERQFLDYNTSLTINFEPIKMMPTLPEISSMSKTLQGVLSQDAFEILPKVALKYECSEHVMTYLTASKGHKTGGYNMQMFSQVIQKAINPMAKPIDIAQVASYRPEITWNYEVGTRFSLFNGRLTGDVAFFYMDIRDVQLTKFVDGGSGRILSNAGRARSCGAEVALGINAAQGLTFDVNYGFTHAAFSSYDGGVDKTGVSVDYSGNFIPYTPRHTLSLGGNYCYDFKDSWISSVGLGLSCSGAGRIYWDESNEIYQPFYALLNARAWVSHKGFTLELWGRNLLGQDYGAFYFESFGRAFVQRGRPSTVGLSLTMEF